MTWVQEFEANLGDMEGVLSQTQRQRGKQIKEKGRYSVFPVIPII